MRHFVIVLTLLALTLLVAAPALAQSNIVHVVAPGENLFRISLRYNVSMWAIAAANGIYNLNYIYAGQRLIIPAYGTGGPIVQPPPQLPPGQFYIVGYGDTLGMIAARFGTTVQSLVSANGIFNANFIYPGQRLLIPYYSTGVPYVPPAQNPVVYTVVRGDTLGTIAARYGTTVQAIATYNGISNLSLIYPGQRLTIPLR